MITHDLWATNRDGISVIDMVALLGAGREREKEKMQEGSVDGQDEILDELPSYKREASV